MDSDSDQSEDNEKENMMKDVIRNGIVTIMKELYGYLLIPFLIIILFLVLHIFELYSLIKLIKCIPKNTNSTP